MSELDKSQQKLADLTATYYEILNDPEGGPDMATKFLEKNDWTHKRFDNALKTMAQKKEDNESFWNKVWDTSGDVVEQFTSAATMGQSAYLQAGVDWLVSQASDDKPMSYSESLSNVRKRDREFRKENPGSSLILDVAGGAIPGIGTANLAMKTGAMTIKAGRPLANTLSQAKVDVPMGVVEEVGRSSARGESAEDVTEAGIWGGTFGMVGSGISGAIEWAGKPVIDFLDDSVVPWFKRNILRTKPTSPAVPKLTKDEEKIADQINQNLEDEGLTRQDIIERADEADELGVENIRLATLAGPESQSTVKNLGIAPGGTKTKVKTELLGDLEDSSENVTKTIKEGMGFNDKGDELIKLGIVKKGKEATDPLYAISYQLGNISNKRLDTILKTLDDTTAGEFYDIVTKLSKRHNADLPPGTKPIPVFLPDEMPYGDIPVEVIDVIQRAVRDLAKKTSGDDARTLWQLRQKVLDITGEETKKSFNALVKDSYVPGRGIVNSKLYRELPFLKEMSFDEIDVFFKNLDAGDGTFHSPFAKERETYGDTQSNIDAYNSGKKAFAQNKTFNQFKDEWNNLGSQTEKDFYRLSAATHAIENIDMSGAETKNFAKQFLSKGQRQKFLLMFDNDPEKVANFIRRLELENEAHKSVSGMLPRSDTAENTLNFFSHLREWMSTSSIENKMLQAGGRFIQKTLNEEVLKKQNKALADAYVGKGREHATTQMQKAGQRESDLAKRAMRQAQTGGSIATGGPGLLAPRGEEEEEPSLLF